MVSRLFQGRTGMGCLFQDTLKHIHVRSARPWMAERAYMDVFTACSGRCTCLAGRVETRKAIVRTQDMTPRYMGIPKNSTVTVVPAKSGGMIAPSKRAAYRPSITRRTP